MADVISDQVLHGLLIKKKSLTWIIISVCKGLVIPLITFCNTIFACLWWAMSNGSAIEHWIMNCKVGTGFWRGQVDTAML